MIAASPYPHMALLDGPVGETNVYRTEPRGRVLLLTDTDPELLRHIGAILVTGNIGVVGSEPPPAGLPSSVASRIIFAAEWRTEENLAGAMVDGSIERLIEVATALASREGPIVPLQSTSDGKINLDLLVREIAVSINTAAAGGNASLMALKDEE